MLDRFLSTLSLVSRIPVKARFNFDPSRMDFYLPLTGIFPALLGLLVFWAGSLFLDSPLITVILVLIVQYLGYNLFHLDGLVDTADAFLGSFDKEKRRAILKDSRIGVYGLFAAIAALSLKGALLLAIYPRLFSLAIPLLAYPLSGRFAAALVPVFARPLNPGGLGALSKDAKPGRAAAGIILALVLWTLLAWCILNLAAFVLTGLNGQDTWPSLGTAPIPGFFAVNSGALVLTALILCLIPAAGVFPARFFAGLYAKNLGGYTGDALGAAIEGAEILHLGLAYILLLFMG
jgi:adenosylcobinamide-GDP ribazoletransferase